LKHTRYVLLTFVVAAMLTGSLVRSCSVALFAQFAMPDSRLFGVLNTSSTLALVCGGLMFFFLLKHYPSRRLVDEVITELRLCTWPTREETVRASTTVILTAFFTAALLAAYDVVWKTVADKILYNES
jgi:preprotein translocase SecE subunit